MLDVPWPPQLGAKGPEILAGLEPKWVEKNLRKKIQPFFGEIEKTKTKICFFLNLT